MSALREKAERMASFYYEALRGKTSYPAWIKAWNRLEGKYKQKTIDAMEAAILAENASEHATTKLENKDKQSC